MTKAKRIRKTKAPTHERVNDILLGPLERPALQWLCAHMPAWVMPDTLTALGVAGAALVTLGYGLARLNHDFVWLASFGLVLNWIGDSLDGSLARYRKIERPRYGFFIDHTFDALAQVMVFVGFAISPYARLDIAMLGLVVYLLMDILVLARTSVQGVFKISYGKVGPTEVRVLVILANAVIYFWNPIIQTPLGPFMPFDFVLFVVATGFSVIFLYNALRLAKQLKDIDARFTSHGDSTSQK
ncbi:MAG: CDP-alcohol phosphatidyltransferase family protein [Anaerolineales bacterium]|nr:CDP-alcohol phosphatidyltransferase family protein [Anaerolineales bacterium]